MRVEKSLVPLCALVFAASLSTQASAATVTNINSTITNAGSCTLTTGCPESYSVATQGATTQIVNVPPQQSFGFTDSFNQSTNVSTGSNLGSSATGAGGPWNFQDNILFTTNGAIVQAQASATLSNVTDLQARIISLNNPGTGTPFNVFLNSNSNGSLLLGGPSVTTIVDGWQTFNINALGVDVTGTMPNPIAAGSYILQIRGETVANPNGSSYSGTVTFTPVPLPAAGWLMLAALGAMGLLLRRHSSASMVGATTV